VLEQAQAGPHPGIDIAAAQHTYIRASGAGLVLEAGSDSVYGLYVLIEHGNTGYRSMYGHASRLYVQSGEQVQQNQVIALSGNTGRSTAPHLHFEILQDGRPVDPFTLVQQPTSS
jgi:murein DD-endopeptidase MepM/ murein hydrolase activator NlpD